MYEVIGLLLIPTVLPRILGPGPYIRYKAHPGLKNLKILIYIRPGPYKSVIRPPSRYKAQEGLKSGPYNGKGGPYNGFFTVGGPYNGKGGRFSPLKKRKKWNI